VNFISLLLIGEEKQTAKKLASIAKDVLDTTNWSKHPDFINIDTELNKSIGIEKVKDFKTQIYNKPFSAKAKIGVIFEAEKLTIQAQNAILKILEEPPNNTFIILLTENEDKLLKTIQSRCSKTYLKNNPKEEYGSYIEKILTNDLNRFLLIDKILIEKNITKRNEKITKLIKDIYAYLKNRNSKDPKTYELIFYAQKFLKTNVNQKLLLENLLLNIKEL
jgi:DNA polymerase III delta prime subunit